MGTQRVTGSDIERGLLELGVDGGVVVHSSLSAFGCVEGGAKAVAQALRAVFPLVMAPAFTWWTCRFPEGLEIERNGRRWVGRHHVPPGRGRFHPDMPVSKGIGVISETVRGMEGAVRGAHPTHSFAAVGQGAREIIATQTWEEPLAPVEVLLSGGGWVLMLGAELTSCTALHASEHMAGREYFVRCAEDAEGRMRSVRVPGCSRAFGNFEGVLEGIKREVRIGSSRVRAYPGGEFLELTVAAIRADGEITRCSPECASCRDMIAGGPVVAGG